MIAISSPRNGAILNRHDGREDNKALRIEVTGTCGGDHPVTVNGHPATVHGQTFRASIVLTARITTLTAVENGDEVSISVIYDRGSFPRYRFSLDDDIWFLRDIAEKQYRSLFDNPYMALWKRLHDTYGTKVNCNLYFECENFDLTMMPDRYRGEWADAAEWFRLTFHARANDPDKPYLHAGYEEVARDMDLVTGEILRFAGESSLNSFTTIHWGEATREGCRAVRDRGIRGLCGYFTMDDAGEPQVSYYADRNLTRYLMQRDYWMDWEEDLVFIRHAQVINTVQQADIVPGLEACARNPQQGEVMELMIHEQYFYPDYVAYLPDYAERCETAVRWMADHGYQPVFYSDGFLGVPSS